MTSKVSESILMLKKAKNLGKYKIFLMAVYMIFKYGKRWSEAESFNNNFVIISVQICANLHKSWKNMMSNDGSIVENMDLSHIHLAVLTYSLNNYVFYVGISNWFW